MSEIPGDMRDPRNNLFLRRAQAAEPQNHDRIPGAWKLLGLIGGYHALRRLSRASPDRGVADELNKLDDLRQRGILSSAEFEEQKRRLLSP